jgi:hypothetical protein
MRTKTLLSFVVPLLLPAFACAQATTSSMNGTIKTNTGETMTGAIITVIHELTGTLYRVQSRTGGYFEMSNLNPGGPYSIEASFINYTTEKKTGIFLNLGDSYKVDLVLSPNAADLSRVVVTATGKPAENPAKGGSETVLGSDKMSGLPSVGRNIYDYLRAIPQASLIGSNEGAVSIAGQNNRYNSFYVDGAINNDVFGLANSGTNGGQTGAAPISIDAIDQFQVVISPYDASIGNFTGGGINAITRSGTNKTEGSVYYFYRNQDLAGKDPLAPKETATRYPSFANKTYGLRSGGPLVPNKLFYFISLEQQRDETPQPYDLSLYKGATHTAAGIQGLVDFVKKAYHYDMGDYLNTTKTLDADRISAKIDWNMNSRHKLSVSYRYNKAESVIPPVSSATRINFSNSGACFPGITQSLSAELKSIAGRSSSNRLLVTYTNVKDDRSYTGLAFPKVFITDGSGGFAFGADNNSTQNLLLQKNVSLVDNFKFNTGKHTLTTGIDCEYLDDVNVFIQNSFGNYIYGSVAAFTANTNAPIGYTAGYPLTDKNLSDHTGAAAKFKVAKAALFFADETRPAENLTLNFGIRADYWKFLSVPATDPFTSDSALPRFSESYDLKGARSGQRPVFPVSLNPRFGFIYRIPGKNITMRGGAGMFTGRLPLAWPGGIYHNNGVYVGNYTATAASLPSIRFRWNTSDPYQSIYTGGSMGVGLDKGPLNLVSKNFSMPKLFRASLAVDKRFGKGWLFTLEAIFSKDINEINYTNINILPPIGVSVGPGSRNVYATENSSSAARIPIRPDGTNPYSHVILLSNHDGREKGYAYHFTFLIKKKTSKGFTANVSYGFGNSWVWNEGTSSVNLSQWSNMETVNGRNFMARNISDFSQGHKIFAYLSKKIRYAKNRMATGISLTYTGQSGTPVSYTYSTEGSAQGTVVGDAGSGGFNDLIYIPTAADLASMVFIPGNGITADAATQKAALEKYISTDKYLDSRRGQFAERNGSRLPFSHRVDMKLAQDFTMKISGRQYQLQLTWDIFNLANFLNREWGRSYFADFDQYPLIQFAGYISATNLTPQYRFNPAIKNLWTYNNSASPAYANRWSSQIGLRVSF